MNDRAVSASQVLDRFLANASINRQA